MRLLRYFSVPCAAILVYCTFSFFFGQNGLQARRYLEGELARLTENRDALLAERESFAGTRENLLTDDDALSVYARPLGFANPEEGFVRVVGLGVEPHVGLPSGRALRATERTSSIPNRSITVVSLVFGAAVFSFLLVGDILWLKTGGRRDNR